MVNIIGVHNNKRYQSPYQQYSTDAFFKHLLDDACFTVYKNILVYP